MSSDRSMSQLTTEETHKKPARTGHNKFILSVFVLAAIAIIIGVAVGIPLSKRDTRSTGDVNLDIAYKVLNEVPLIDGHNDFPWQILQYAQNKINNVNFNEDLRPVWTKDSPVTHADFIAQPQTDIPRLLKGKLGGVFWVAFGLCESSGKDAVRIGIDQVDVIHRMIDKYPDVFRLATSADEIESAFAVGKIASLIGLEGGHLIGNTLGDLRMYYRLGTRYMTLTHSCDTDWATNWRVDINKTSSKGLTEFGKIVVKEMNRLGMMVDLSHVSKQTMLDALEVTKAPVIFSHSSAFGLCPHYRNVQDDVLMKTKQNRGLVMVNFYNTYVNCGENKTEITTMRHVIEHINYIRNKIGVEHVGIGADYDGVDLLPVGLEDVSKYPYLFAELSKNHDWSEEDLKKLAGLNLLRVFREVERVRDAQKSVVEPYEDRIPENEISYTNCTTSI